VRDGGVATSRPHAPHIPARALRAVSARDAATAFGARVRASSGLAVRHGRDHGRDHGRGLIRAEVGTTSGGLRVA